MILSKKSYEHFFLFFTNKKSHKGLSLSNDVLELLNEHANNINGYCVQTYDNTCNMFGKYADIKKKINSLCSLCCTFIKFG